MRLTLPNLLSIFIFFVLAVEGLGIAYGHDASYWLIVIIAPLCFVHTVLNKKKLVFPKKISLIFLFFLLSQLLSTIFSVNATSSFALLFLTIANGMFFICTYNYSKELDTSIPVVIFFLTLLFIIYSASLNQGLFALHVPDTGYQFVYSKYGSHNHIGDFIILPIILAIYHLYKRTMLKSSIIAIITFIPFVILSFSRSSYFTLALSTIIIHFMHLKQEVGLRVKLVTRIFLLGIIFSTLFLIIGTTSQASNQRLLRTFHNFFVQNKHLQTKDILGSRIEYLKEAYHAFGENPLIGIGPNNFIVASNKYTENPYKATTRSPHNIFIEVLVGQGIIGFVFFLLLILLILKNTKKTSLFFVFLAMLINFQTDYTYQINGFFLLFFIVAGVITNDKDIPVYKLRNYIYNKIQK